VFVVFRFNIFGFRKIFSPNRTKRLLSGVCRAVFEVLIHYETSWIEVEWLAKIPNV